MRIVFGIFFLFVFSGKQLTAQNPKIDSLSAILKTAKQDFKKVKLLSELNRELILIGEGEKVLRNAEDVLSLIDQLSVNATTAEKDSLNLEKSVTYIQQGSGSILTGNTEKALSYYEAALQIAKKLKNNRKIANALGAISSVHIALGNYPKALEFQLKSLQLKESRLSDGNTTGTKNEIAISQSNLGLIYQNLGDIKKAVDYYIKSQKTYELCGNKSGAGQTFHNLGTLYEGQKEFEISLSYYLRAIQVRKEIGDMHGLAGTLDDIGNLYEHWGKIDKEIEYHLEALKIYREMNDINGKGICFINIGQAYSDKGDAKNALHYMDSALSIGKEIGSLEIIKNTYFGFYKVYDTNKNNRPANLSKENSIQKALDYFKLYNAMQDTIFNEDYNIVVAEMQSKYETEKKDGEIKLLNKDKEKQAQIANEESKRNKIIILSISLGLLFVLTFAVFIYRSYREKKKANIIITAQKEEVEKAKELIQHQKELVEEKQKEIIDSIRYAKRIQQSLMPPLKYIDKTIKRLNG